MDGLSSRPYTGEVDLRRMMGFLSLATLAAPPGAYWHPGDVVWGMYQNTVFEAHCEVRLWEDDDGLLGFAWLEEPDGVVMHVHPRLRSSGLLEGEMLDWAVRQTRAVYGEKAGDELWTRVPEDEPRLDALLADLGFARDPDHALKLSRHLDDPPDRPAPPGGWTVREVGGKGEWEERVEIHREVWHPSRVTLEAYRRLRGGAGLRPQARPGRGRPRRYVRRLLPLLVRPRKPYGPLRARRDSPRPQGQGAGQSPHAGRTAKVAAHGRPQRLRHRAPRQPGRQKSVRGSGLPAPQHGAPLR